MIALKKIGLNIIDEIEVFPNYSRMQLLVYNVLNYDYQVDCIIDQLWMDFSYESIPQMADCWVIKQSLTHPKQ